jgi:hypothetical protein
VYVAVLQVSTPLQYSPSLQSLSFRHSTHWPESDSLQKVPGEQLIGVPSWQTPLLQVSCPLQTKPSSQFKLEVHSTQLPVEILQISNGEVVQCELFKHSTH